MQAINGRRPTNTKRNEIGRVPSFRTKKKATILAEMVVTWDAAAIFRWAPSFTAKKLL